MTRWGIGAAAIEGFEVQGRQWGDRKYCLLQGQGSLFCLP